MPKGYDIMAGILRSEERRLRAELAEIRTRFEHAGNKGAAAEREFRSFLRKYMPGDTRVGHGEVFDIDGRLAKQTDVIVANEYHVALQADWEQTQKFTIEAVQCAAEVKSSLTDLGSLRDCVEKARAFKSLLVAPEQHMLTTDMMDDERRFRDRRPFFTFAFESRLKLETIYEALTGWDEELRDVERPVVDGLFVLDRGVLMHLGTGRGTLVLEDEHGKRLSGYAGFEAQSGVLTRLLLWMYAAMPKAIHFRHPVFPYLQPRKSEPLWLNNRGKVEPRPSVPTRATDSAEENDRS